MSKNEEQNKILEDEQVSNDTDTNDTNLSEENNDKAEQQEESTEENFDSVDAQYKAKMEAKVQEAQKKEQEAHEKYLRTHADFENIKKRLEKEKYQAIEYASEKFAKDLLAPIDALQMALLSANSNVEPEQLVEKLKEGIELTVKAFNKAFEKHDIVEVEYDKFNPEYHNAVMKVDSDEVESGQIVQVMQKGYKFKDRLLREAMVSVAN
jgi:molecular chaperone GrpE